MSAESAEPSPSEAGSVSTVRLPLWLKLGGLMFLQYGLITVNMIAVSHYNRLATAATDLALSYMGYTILKQIVEAKTRKEQIAYSIGGMLGAQFALFFPR